MTSRLDELKASANKAIIKKQYDVAIGQLDEAIRLAPNSAALWSNRAYVRELRNEPELALSDAHQCIALAADFPKGHLRLARALMALGRSGEALERLEQVVARFPQDYSLMEALNDARSQGGPAAGGVAASEAPLKAAPASSSDRGGKGLHSSYYYAAVPASQRTLPVAAPQLIAGGTAGGSGPQPEQRPGELAAAGAVKQDIERKGDDSYYYAHARAKDYHVPTVPKRIEADGSLSPWAGPKPS